MSKTIALAKQNAEHGPVASDVVSRTIALAKEKEVRKLHPLTGGLSGLLGNSEEAIQTSADGVNGTAAGNSTQGGNGTAPANVTVPKVKKNTTVPDGSNEPVKPELGNASGNSSAPTRAANISAKVDKAFGDAAKLPEHSHDGIKDANSSNLTANVTVVNQTLAQKPATASNGAARRLMPGQTSPALAQQKAANMTTKVDKAFKEAEKLPENENHGINATK